MKRLATILLLVCFAMVTAVNLGAQATGEILHAEYGAGDRWIDVTQRVGSLFYRNRANFRADNSTLGVDPAPGVPKVFHLVVRDGSGRIQQLEFRENQRVTLRGYNFPNDSRGLRVLGALYGAGNQVMDVTGQLNAQIQGGQLGTPVSNRTMGGDPAQGQLKVLTVWYSVDGRLAQAVVNENDYLNLPGGPGFSGDNRGDRGRGADRGPDGGQGRNGDRGRDNGQGFGNQGDRGYDQARVERVVLPPGTEVALRTLQRIDSRDVVEGQTFPAQIEEDVLDTDGSIAIPRGSDANLITRRLENNGDITLDVESIMVGGRRYRVSTQDQELQNRRDGVGANQRTGEFVGGGAVLGAIIGAIAGGGKGAAIGAAAGAGAGASTQIITRGKEVHVPAESVIRFRLDRPLRLHLWQ